MQSGQLVKLVPPTAAVAPDAFLRQLDLFFGQAVQVVGYAALAHNIATFLQPIQMP